MKDRTARALAIVALVFMTVFLVSFTAMLIDKTIFNGGIGYIALSSGMVVFLIFIVLKADGRGFSLAKMKAESEMRKIEDALAEQDGEDGDKGADAVDRSEDPKESDGSATADAVESNEYSGESERNDGSANIDKIE